MQNERTGAMPSGHNGPYHDPETPVRNTSHWVITFIRADELGDSPRFLEAAENALEFLTSPAARPHGAAFLHRNSGGKDHCNGLIGQAWTIEALAVAAEHLNRCSLYNLATEVFLSHPFDQRVGLWKRVEVDGTVLPFDRTFNHQLWFAAAGGLLARQGDTTVSERVSTFLDRLPALLDVDESGLIRHPLRPSISPVTVATNPARYRGLIRSHVLHYLRPPSRKRALETKAIGYHGFNLYALALLKRSFPSHPVWDSSVVQRVLSYAQSSGFREAIADNPYGYPYNPPGFEVPFAFEVFDQGDRSVRRNWIESQIRCCFDQNSSQMSKNTEDPITNTARLYEATRLSDYDLAYSEQ